MPVLSKMGVVCMGICTPEVLPAPLYPSATVHVLEPWWNTVVLIQSPTPSLNETELEIL